MRLLVSLVGLLCGAQAALATSAFAASGWTAYVANSSSNSVTPFNTATNVPGAPITVGSQPDGIAIAPDGRTAYVANFGDLTVSPISTATNTTGTAIFTGGIRPAGIAITPDGRTAYVVSSSGGSVIPINTATNAVGTPITIGGSLQRIAITPDGRTAYVTDQSAGTVIPINTATNTAGTPIIVGGLPQAIAITPDGRTAYVVISALAGTVIPINTATNTAGTPIPVGQNPIRGIAITPNGRTVYVANRGSNTVTPIDVATNTPGTPIPVGIRPDGVAVTPDGKTAYIANNGSNTVTPINTATNTAGTPIPVGIGPIQLAIVPDQAPRAAFSVTAAPAGSASRFNASASSSPVGSIAIYSWNFGDGHTATTTSPRTAHVYARHGTFAVRLTVTNTAGTSLTQTFTGQTVSNQGGPQATTAHAVRIAGGSTLSGLTISPSKVSISGRLVAGKCVAPTNRNKNKPHCRLPIRLLVGYRLSAASTVTFTIQRKSGGRFVPVPGAIVKAGKAGQNSFVFDGTIGGRQLGAGTYQMTGAPRGGASQTTTFKITD